MADNQGNIHDMMNDILGNHHDMKMQRIRPYLLDPREEYPEPYYLLEYNGVPFSPLGGIQAISGQKKNGKSFVLTQLMAAILGGGKVETFLPGLKVPQKTLDYLGHEPRVLYCDTEMEKLNSAKVLRRVHWLCGWDMRQPNDRFNVLWLRTVESDTETGERAFEKRFRLIMTAIDELKPDIVFIDGIRDIIGDFNDNEESSALVLELMALAQNKNICIWNALHMNPRPGNDDESKMRGHLGTELGNKVTDTLISKKSKKGGEVSFTVTQQDARGKDMDDWAFVITDDAGNLGIPKITGTPQPEQEDILTDEIINKLRSILPNGKSLRYTDIRKELSVDKKDMTKLLNSALKNGILNQNRIDNATYYSFNHNFGNDNTLPF